MVNLYKLSYRSIMVCKQKNREKIFNISKNESVKFEMDYNIKRKLIYNNWIHMLLIYLINNPPQRYGSSSETKLATFVK